MNDKSPTGSMFDMFQKFGENLKLPTPEVESVVNYHKKNIQAMQDAMQVASSGAQGMMAKQREQLEEGLAEITELVQGMSGKGSPTELMSDQLEFAKKSFEKTIKNTTELGEIARDSSTESFNILQKRVQDSIQEIRSGMGKTE